ncbi:MAG: class I tRNA ligase family protein [Candidatus Hermodarchaeota archaeon]
MSSLASELSETKRYDFRRWNPIILDFWRKNEIYRFDPTQSVDNPWFLIDTPPITINGRMHHGHAYSYSKIDFIARYKRMQGYRLFFPNGWDDNGHPTEKYTEAKHAIQPRSMLLSKFREMCYLEADHLIQEQNEIFQQLGFSADSTNTYRTSSPLATKLAQEDFLRLYKQNFAYKSEGPMYYCIDCRTALSKADLEPETRKTKLYRIAILLDNSSEIIIATTRPELLPAAVALCLNPKDSRLPQLRQLTIRNPFNNEILPIIEDLGTTIDFGTGIQMSCTWGEQEDIFRWRHHNLETKVLLNEDGTLNTRGLFLQGLSIEQARYGIINWLKEQGLYRGESLIEQTLGTCWRCHTPIEILPQKLWYLKLIPFKKQLRKLTDQLLWFPRSMRIILDTWIENLSQDWCITRNRFYGIPIPTWTCNSCGKEIIASLEDLPIDPMIDKLPRCECGSFDFTPDGVFDTWMTSSLTPLLAFKTFFPNTDKIPEFDLHPQAKEILRTWAFYTLYKWHSKGNDKLPWKIIAISGWGLNPATDNSKRNNSLRRGTAFQKPSKTTGTGYHPTELLEMYSADGLRYWAASAKLGKDTHLDFRILKSGRQLANKIYNTTRLLLMYPRPEINETMSLLEEDQQLVEFLKKLSAHISKYWNEFDYSTALKETEWGFRCYTDNYLEIMKIRIKTQDKPNEAIWLAYLALELFLKLFAPLIPFITEFCWLALSHQGSIHLEHWPSIKSLPQTGIMSSSLNLLYESLITIRCSKKLRKKMS